MKQDLNPDLVPVMAVLLSEGKAAAMACIAEKLSGPAEKLRADAERLEASANAARNLVMLMTSGVNGPAVPLQAIVTPPSEDKEWRAHVLRAADAIADLLGGEVSVDEVLESLTKDNVPLQGKRPGTSIGNILNRDARWTRVVEGKYKRQSSAEATNAA